MVSARGWTSLASPHVSSSSVSTPRINSSPQPHTSPLVMSRLVSVVKAIVPTSSDAPDPYKCVEEAPPPLPKKRGRHRVRPWNNPVTTSTPTPTSTSTSSARGLATSKPPPVTSARDPPLAYQQTPRGTPPYRHLRTRCRPTPPHTESVGSGGNLHHASSSPSPSPSSTSSYIGPAGPTTTPRLRPRPVDPNSRSIPSRCLRRSPSER